MARSAHPLTAATESGVHVRVGSIARAGAAKPSVWGPATLKPVDTPHRRAGLVAPGPLAVENATILAVTEDEELKLAIDRIANMHLFEVVFARDASHAVASAFLRPPDAVVVELGSAGLDVSRGLRGLLGAAVPMLFVANEGTLAQRTIAADAGAALFLARPIDPEGLALALRQMIASREGEGRGALLAGGSEAEQEALSAALEPRLHTTKTDSLTGTLDAMAAQNPDVVVLFAGERASDALDVCRAIRISVEWQDVPIVIVGAAPSLRAAALRAGADDFATADLPAEEVALRISARAERARRARQRFDNDSLTGLPHRRGFLERLSRSYAECVRHDRSLAIALCDVDHFKAVNDRYGHAVGDLVLAALGRLLAGSFRAQDLRGRWGGEEFVLAFPGERAASIESAVRGVLDQLAALPFLVGDRPPLHVTFSAGLASSPQDGSDIGELLRVADRRLYEAKRAGRARVVAEG
jgi:diguanylate cyclase (GGDEF)-like protein